MNTTYKMYDEIGLTTDVDNASNHKLIQLLFDKCLQNIEQAKHAMTAKDIIKKCYFISKAMYIINYLRSCLNLKDKNAMELSTLLRSIYIYIETQLLDANRYNLIEHLNEASKTLTTIKSGWDAIESHNNAVQANI